MSDQSTSVFARRQGYQRRVEGFTLESVPDPRWLRRLSIGFVIWIAMTLTNMSLKASDRFLTRSVEYDDAEWLFITITVFKLVVAVAGIVSTWLITTPEKRECLPNRKIFAWGTRLTYITMLVLGIFNTLFTFFFIRSALLEVTDPVRGLVYINSLLVFLLLFFALILIILYFNGLLQRLEMHELARQFKIAMVGIMAVLGLGVLVALISLILSGSVGEGLMMWSCCFLVFLLGFMIYALVVFACMGVQVIKLNGHLDAITEVLHAEHERELQEQVSAAQINEKAPQ